MRNPLIVRYQMFCDDRSGSAADELRLAELVTSLTSLELFLAPLVPLCVVLYSLAPYQSRLTEVLASFRFAQAEVLIADDASSHAFAASIQHCTTVDRLCIRRMLTDFTRLPSDHYRLLLGTDVIFQRPPTELLQFLEGSVDTEVLYMVDISSFGGQPYRLTYHDGPLLAGLLGDFYCLAPGVSVTADQVRDCLTKIDAWPPEARWTPHPYRTPADYVHACEQQAAAILLAQFQARALPPDTYLHGPAAKFAGPRHRFCTVLHAHHPSALLFRGALTPELSQAVLARWHNLGMRRALAAARWPQGALEKALDTGKRLVRQWQDLAQRRA